nr:MAG: wsv260-like protein [Sesarmops intermedium nimavirus]
MPERHQEQRKCKLLHIQLLVDDGGVTHNRASTITTTIMAAAAATGKTTSTTTTTAAPTVRFSDEPEIYHPEEIPAPVSTGAGKRGRRSSRRRNHVQQKTQEDLFEKFANQLTFPNLATEVKRYVPQQLISGVPNNGRVFSSPASYCSDCVDRIASYFENENLAKNILKNDDGQVCNIKDFKKLATLFLGVQHLQFYDHVTVEAFNNNAMEKGGSMYGVPLSMACLSDAAGSGNLYEKLAGKETVCAAFSTGVAMQCGTSKLMALSENNFKTHKQLLEENVDPNRIRSGCSCLKSDEWLQKREEEVNRLMQKNKKVCNQDNVDETKEEGEEEEMMNHDKEKVKKHSEKEEDTTTNKKEEAEEDSKQSEDVDDSDFRPDVDETKEEGEEEEEEMNHEKEKVKKHSEKEEDTTTNKKEEAEKYFEEEEDSERSEDVDDSDFCPDVDETKEEGEEMMMNHEKEKVKKHSEKEEDTTTNKKEEAEKYFEEEEDSERSEDVDDSDFCPDVDETKEEGEEMMMNHEKEKVKKHSEKEEDTTTNKKEEAEKYFEEEEDSERSEDVDDSDFCPDVDETKEEGEEMMMNHEKEKVKKHSEKEEDTTTNKKEEAEKYFEEDVDDSDFRPDVDETKEEGEEEEEMMNHEKEKVKKHSEKEEDTTTNKKEEAEKYFEEDVDDSDFRPGNFVQPVEKEEDFDNERWSNMRTTSSCLALCRHAQSCVVNAINKARVLENLILVRLPKNKKEGIAFTTPEEEEEKEEEFTVIAHPERYLIFSLGATVYEALAYRCDDDDFWNDMEEDRLVSSKKIIAKVYTTVHTVAAPFLKSAPVCHIDQQNKYGYYKTFRIRFPGNFSGYYNDTSIGWRSELYSHITASAAQAECRGDKKSHSSFSEGGWPRREPFKIEGGIVYDDSGDKSGNYLTSLYDGFFGISGVSEREEKMTAVIAYANIRNLTAALKNIKEYFGELLTGTFKQQLVELKKQEIKRTRTEETTAHETQRLNDNRTDMTKAIKITAQTIEMYEKCLKSLEIDLGTMNKYLSYNLKGYTAAAAAAYDNDNAYYL